MAKMFLFILICLSLQIFCEYKTYDGTNLISLSYSVNEDYNAEPPVSMENFNEEMISYYSWFVSFGNCKEFIIPYSCCKNNTDFFTKKWTIISHASLDEYFNFNYVLWRSDEYKKYILSFPGTRNIINELPTEVINSRLTDYNEGEENGIKVVSYFKNVAFEIINLIYTKDILEDIKNHPGYQFISMGHSLGASVAAIVLYEGVNKKYIDSSVNEPVLLTFGMPRTGNENFVLDFNSKVKNNIRVVRDGDLVVDIPYSPISGSYRHLGGLVLINKDMNKMYYCPKDIGEGYSDKQCKKSFSVNYNYHLHYFNPETMISKRCVY